MNFNNASVVLDSFNRTGVKFINFCKTSRGISPLLVIKWDELLFIKVSFVSFREL